MRSTIVRTAALFLSLLTASPAMAWYHAGPRGTASGGGGSWSANGWRGGSASGSDGHWSGTGYRGGTASGGGGSWNATGYKGGTASGGDGHWNANGANGGTASGGDGYWHGTTASGTNVYGGYNRYYGGNYAYYHPPVVVDNYYGTGCYDCGGWNAAGAAAVGMAAGAAVGAANEQQATANAYAAGVAAGSAGATYPLGAIYTTLPAGCVLSPANSKNYYYCNGTWFQPGYGANGVFYRVVNVPS